ncbi:MAG: O-antigen ligase domain-containing protein, partial [Flavobacterium sp.]|nr:O-antigen ligase domain-containing protein [Flavobacterium sp.]
MISNTQYNQIIAFHVGLGLIIYIFEPIAILFGLVLLFGGIYWIWRNNNQNEEALLVCAYLMGVEVFLRMTKGTISHEFVKYAIMSLLLLGMFFKGFSRNAIPYWIFFVLLLPGIVTGMLAISGEERFRQILMFNLS